MCSNVTPPPGAAVDRGGPMAVEAVGAAAERLGGASVVALSVVPDQVGDLYRLSICPMFRRMFHVH
jgi:hypothetical protein